MKVKHGHKPSKHDKDGPGSHALRRRLPFTAGPTYLPLKGKKVYLDLKNFRGVKPVEDDLLSLGATIEKFLSKEINYLISSHDKARGHRSLGHSAGNADGSGASQGVSTPSPGVSTPSPFNMGLDVSPSGVGTQKKEQTSRGRAMFRLARVDVARTVLDNAEKWGVKIVHVESALNWIHREKQKALAVKGQATSGQNVKAKKNSQKKGKLLKCPLVKFESDTRGYRPHYLELDSWPHVNVDTPRGTCPFDGVFLKSAARRGAVQAERLGAVEPNPGALSSQREDRGQNTPKQPIGPQNEGSRKTDSLGFGQLVTGGQLKRLRDKRKRAEKKRGYCECCRVKYEDLHKHIQGADHLQYVRDEKVNYTDLDRLIQKGPSIEEFVKMAVKHKGLTTTVRPSLKRQESSEDMLILISPFRKKQAMQRQITPTSRRKSNPVERAKLAGKKTPRKHNKASKSKTPSRKLLLQNDIGANQEAKVVLKEGDNSWKENVKVKSSPTSQDEVLVKPCSVSCEVLQLSPSKRKQGEYIVKDSKNKAEITVNMAKISANNVELSNGQLGQLSELHVCVENQDSNPTKSEEKVEEPGSTFRSRGVCKEKAASDSPPKLQTLGRCTRRLSLNKNEKAQKASSFVEVEQIVTKTEDVTPVPRGLKSPKRSPAAHRGRVSVSPDANHVERFVQSAKRTKSPDTISVQSMAVGVRARKKARIISSKNIRKCKNVGLKQRWRTFKSVRHFKLPQKWRMLSDRSVSKIFNSDEENDNFEGFTEADLCFPSEVPTDLSYVEVSDIVLEEGSDIEWEITLPSCNTSVCEPLPSQLVVQPERSSTKVPHHPLAKEHSALRLEGMEKDKSQFHFSPPVDRSGLGYDPGDDFQCSPDVGSKKINFAFSSPRVPKDIPETISNEQADLPSKPGQGYGECVFSSPHSRCSVRKDDFLENLRKQSGNSPFIFSNPVSGPLVTPVKTPSRLKECTETNESQSPDDEIEFNFSSPQRLKTAFSPLKSCDFIQQNHSLPATRTSPRRKSKTSKQLNLSETAPASVNLGDDQNADITTVSEQEVVTPPHSSPVKCKTAFSASLRMAANFARHSPRDWSKYCEEFGATSKHRDNCSTPVKNKSDKPCNSFDGTTKTLLSEPDNCVLTEGQPTDKAFLGSHRHNRRLSLSRNKDQKAAVPRSKSGCVVKPKSQPIQLNPSKRTSGSPELSKSAEKQQTGRQKKLLTHDAENSDDKRAMRIYRFDYITTANRKPKTFSTAKRVRKPCVKRSASVPNRDGAGDTSAKCSLSPGPPEVVKQPRRISENFSTDCSNDMVDFDRASISRWKSKSGRLIKPDDYQRRPRAEILHYSKTHLKKQKQFASEKSKVDALDSGCQQQRASPRKGDSPRKGNSPRKGSSPRKGNSPRKGASLYDFDSS